METLARSHRGTGRLFEEFAQTRDGQLRHELVDAHMGLAYHLARRFVDRGEPYDDLVQVASVALIHSVDRFDPDRGVQFSTFATTNILGELKRHFRDHSWGVRAPRRIQELFLELGPAVELLTQMLERSPTTVELARAVGNSEDAVLEALDAGRNRRTQSIDSPDRDGVPLASRLGDLDADLRATEERVAFEQSLLLLPALEQRILNLRYVEGLTQSEIAVQVGASQMHVSRLLARSLTALRATVGHTI